MRATPVITGALLLFALGACGQAADQGAPANAPAPTTASSPPSSPSSSTPAPTSGLPQGALQVPSDRLDTSALPEYYRGSGKVWVLNDGRTLQLTAMARDACAGVQAKVIEQNDTVVRIELSPMDAPQGGSPDGPGMCAEVLTPRMVTVDLKAPLGNRRVIVSGG
jgi:hypothetical protein